MCVFFFVVDISALEPCSSLGVASAFSANLLPFFFLLFVEPQAITVAQ